MTKHCSRLVVVDYIAIIMLCQKEVAFPSSQPATQPLDGSFEMDDSQSQVGKGVFVLLIISFLFIHRCGIINDEYYTLFRIQWRVFGASSILIVELSPGFLFS